MAKSKTIQRRKPALDALSFDSLRREGIGLAQQFSGQVWTDYNLHDPGVTILEQLCYGLTDLIYRTDFSVEDILSNENDELDLDHLGLALPEQILSSRPCTEQDHQTAILDAVPEIERVWIKPATDSYNGLYQIEVQLTDDTWQRCQTRSGLHQRVIDKIAQVYAKMRNLGEDIIDVKIIDGNGYSLKADIDIDPHVEAEEVLARVYFCTEQWLTGQRQAPAGFEDELLAGNTLEQILNGPLTVYGRQGLHTEAVKSVSALYAAIIELDGVVRINELQLIPVSANEQLQILPIKTVPQQAWFCPPIDDQSVEVVIRRNANALTLDFATTKVRYDQRHYKKQAVRQTRQEFTSLYQLPKGNYRQLDQYYSVQGHFPATYHLNVLGVSKTVSTEHWAQIQQLKGYLLIFEQFMANFGANLGGVRQLFSLDRTAQSSYRFHLMDNKTVVALDQLYPEHASDKFNEILARFDPYGDRKGRLLDYLMALYGETFDTTLLRQYNHYYSEELLEGVILDNKFNFLKGIALKGIVALGKDRGGGFDHNRQSQGSKNSGGFAARLAFALGMNSSTEWPYSACVTKQALTVVSDSQFEAGRLAKKLQFDIDDALLKRMENVDFDYRPGKLEQKLKRKIVATVLPLRENQIAESLFQNGVKIGNYKLIDSDRLKGFDVYLRTKHTERTKGAKPWLYIGNGSTEQKAMAFVNLFSRFLTGLNINSEGLSVVEHILLRPDCIGSVGREKAEEEPEQDDYSFQISVIMPGFTARCADLGFRLQAEMLIAQNCPAHILPHCLWLNFEAMCEFETLHLNWLEARRSSVMADSDSIEAAKQLMAFIQTKLCAGKAL
jgi:hypothetical protein